MNTTTKTLSDITAHIFCALCLVIGIPIVIIIMLVFMVVDAVVTLATAKTAHRKGN